jgi:hypothetical protein
LQRLRNPWLLALIPASLVSILLVLPFDFDDSPLWIIVLWLSIAASGVVSSSIGFALGIRGSRLILLGCWGAAACFLIVPVAFFVLASIGLLVGVVECLIRDVVGGSEDC